MVRTLADLRTAAKERADMAASSFVTDDEWRRYLNGSAAWLYGLLCSRFEDYNILPNEQATDGTDRLDLPADFFKLRGVDLKTPGTPTGWTSVRPFNFAERNRVATTWSASAVRYRLLGAELWLTPLPPAGETIRTYYTPQLADLEDDADTLDGVNGWDQLVVLDAARKALVKEESDTSAVEREIAALVQRIETESQNRDAGEPATVADVQRGGYALNDPWWP